MARIDTASPEFRAIIAAAVAEAIASRPAPSPIASEASAHYVARDLACAAKKPCAKTFRTAKGVAWHVANVKH